MEFRVRARLRLWASLVAAALLGGALGAPYLLAALDVTLAALDAPGGITPERVLVAQGVQVLVLAALASWIGVVLAPKVGIDAPYFRAWAERRGWPEETGRRALVALVAGTVASLALVAMLRGVFLPRLPEVFSRGVSESALVNFSAIFFGGFVEEILMRWGLLTLLVWLATKARLGAGAAFWSGNVGAALAFGAGHLGLAAALAGGALTPLLVAYVLVGNGFAALVFGWLYRRYGLETAILAHMVADVWIHVVPALVNA